MRNIKELSEVESFKIKSYSFVLFVIISLTVFVLSYQNIVLSQKIKSIHAENKIDRHPSDNLKLNVGDKAPGFVLPDLTGNDVSLSNYKKQKMILVIWSLDCHFCQKHFPKLRKKWSPFLEKGYQLLTVELSNSQEKLKKYFKENNIKNIPTLLDNKNIVKQKYGIKRYPVTLLLNKKRVIKRIR